jgi:hypothetical protein
VSLDIQNGARPGVKILTKQSKSGMESKRKRLKLDKSVDRQMKKQMKEEHKSIECFATLSAEKKEENLIITGKKCTQCVCQQPKFLVYTLCILVWHLLCNTYLDIL